MQHMISNCSVGQELSPTKYIFLVNMASNYLFLPQKYINVSLIRLLFLGLITYLIPIVSSFVPFSYYSFKVTFLVPIVYILILF